ncbi:MAG: nucleotidyltransferase [Bacteroidales bacterium]|nr:nucleotidyltransferase [Bacteroidales bacterium]MDD4823592.1 nucleotidyltransferase [Bacteroidales bacterium]
MVKPTLFVLAAGLGNKYGGMRQQESIGPNGETILDYTVFDACRAGFGKIIFVIYSAFEKEFKEFVLSKYEGRIAVEYLIQDKNNADPGNKIKAPYPWSSICALWAGKDLLQTPFGIVNAEDFYGKESFEILAEAVKNVSPSNYFNVAFELCKTLSETSPLTRGICVMDDENNLSSIVDHLEVEMTGGNVVYKNRDNKRTEIDGQSIASINMWAVHPDIFNYAEKFVDKIHQQSLLNEKVCYTITEMVNVLLTQEKVKVKVLITPSEWLGLASADDRVPLVLKINEYIKAQRYPKSL